MLEMGRRCKQKESRWREAGDGVSPPSLISLEASHLGGRALPKALTAQPFRGSGLCNNFLADAFYGRGGGF